MRFEGRARAASLCMLLFLCAGLRAVSREDSR
jgi:hypothetical protein